MGVLIYLYLFSLIVGGVLLGASILLGGGHADADADADGDLGADGGADKDLGHGDAGGLLVMFLSLRFWTFFLAFFGLTGLALDVMDLVGNAWLTLALALGMGFGTGSAAMAVLRALSRDTTGKAVESGDYVGKTARVVVPFEGAHVGKVRVELKGSSIDLLASGVEDDAFEGREEVLIVEMDGTRARVARVHGAKRSSSQE